MNVQTNNPGTIERFFWWCAGVDSEILRACPLTEHIKYSGIGGTVFFMSLLAALSGGYALFTVFASIPAAVFFGLLWGVIIFNLDRFIVSTIKKEGRFRRQFTLAIPRLVLAVVLAIVITKPLELRIFRGEIEAVLAQRKEQRGAAAGAGFVLRSSELETRILSLGEQTDLRFQQREKDYQDYKCECDGTCGSGKRGRGSECERKEQAYLQSNQEYQAVKAANEAEIVRLREEMNALAGEAAAARQLGDNNFSKGLMARLSASNELPQVPGFMLILLFSFLGIAPVLTKILAPRGPYDEILSRVK